MTIWVNSTYETRTGLSSSRELTPRVSKKPVKAAFVGASNVKVLSPMTCSVSKSIYSNAAFKMVNSEFSGMVLTKSPSIHGNYAMVAPAKSKRRTAERVMFTKWGVSGGRECAE
jgi:hypothetical protein